MGAAGTFAHQPAVVMLTEYVVALAGSVHEVPPAGQRPPPSTNTTYCHSYTM
jgi:hypothetical protein